MMLIHEGHPEECECHECQIIRHPAYADQIRALVREQAAAPHSPGCQCYTCITGKPAPTAEYRRGKRVVSKGCRNCHNK